MVVNKPGGLLSVPGRGPDKQDCVVNRLKDLFPSCIAQPAVHRLDMATSVLMVLALTKETHAALAHQFTTRQVEKKYIALLEGDPMENMEKSSCPFASIQTIAPIRCMNRCRGKQAAPTSYESMLPMSWA